MPENKVTLILEFPALESVEKKKSVFGILLQLPESMRRKKKKAETHTHQREEVRERRSCIFSHFSEAEQCLQRRDFAVADLNSLHVNKWATEAAGSPLITTVGAVYANPFPCSPLDKDENPQHQVLKETEEAHKPIYRVPLDQSSSFEPY